MDASTVSSLFLEIAGALEVYAEHRVPAGAHPTSAASLGAERRAHVRRRPLDLPRPIVARFKHGPVLALVDVSEGGALADTRTRLIPGTQVILEFLTPGARRRATMPSRVLRAQVTAIESQGLRYRGSFAFGQPLELLEAEAHIDEPPLPIGDAAALADAILSIRSVAAGSRDLRAAKLLDDVALKVQAGATPTSLMHFVEEQLRRHVPLLAVVFGTRPRVRRQNPCESLAFELGRAGDHTLDRMHVEFRPACTLDDAQVRLLHVGASIMSLVYTWARDGAAR
jgi:hypothetical protein